MEQEKLVPKRRFEGFTDEWEKLILAEATSKTGDGLHGTPKYKNDGTVFFINGNNLVNGKIIINEETRRVSEEEQSKDDKTLCENTILMSINGTIGNLAWYNGEKLMLGKSVAYIQVKDYDKRFIYSFLQTNNVYKYFINSLTGSTIKNLGLKAIRETTLYAPNKKEQQKIGQFFKHLDEMIALEQRKMDKTLGLKSAYLAEMFPAEGERVPKRRFEGFTEEWEVRNLKNCTSLITKGTTPKVMSLNGSVNLVKVENIKNRQIIPIMKINNDEHENYLKRSKLQQNDILFSIAGTLGRTALVKISVLPANTNQALAIIRGYDFDTNFLLTALEGPIVTNYIKQNPTIGAQPNLSLEQVGNLKISTPSREEQQKIGAFFKKIDDKITNHQQRLAKLKATKQAYLHEMFV